MRFFDYYFDMVGFEPNLRSFIMSELTSPHRHYHGVGHHALMLQHLGEDQGPWIREHVAATFFHDIVYDPHRSDNEEMSAATARLWLPNNLDADLVIEAILATKSHKLVAIDTGIFVSRRAAIQQFLYADLMILWTDHPRRYAWYAHGVRKEYAHVPNDIYRAGRARVLEDLRGNIHPYVGAPKSIQMSHNIDWELAELDRGALDV